MLSGIVEQHQVEFAPNDLPRLRSFVIVVLTKTKWLRDFSLLVNELDAVLLGEVASFHLAKHA